MTTSFLGGGSFTTVAPTAPLVYQREDNHQAEKMASLGETNGVQLV